MKDTYLTGTLAGAGSFRCDDCSYAVVFDSLERVPDCPRCGAASFSRASLFEVDSPLKGSEIPAEDDVEWVQAVCDNLDGPGHYLVCREDDRVSVVPLELEWTKIGRSPSADITFDDPTVSRRHALIVREPGGVRVLDDRSLNGVFVNGERVEWSALHDRDELIIGRYRLHFLDTTDAAARTSTERGRGLTGRLAATPR